MTLALGLIGYPIGHSLSPWIHGQFMDKLGIDGEYRLYETTKANLGETVKLLKSKQVDGFNVTVPYKQDIMEYLDELDPDAEKIGAVNTVVSKNGTWKGYNTDGQGYVRSVKSDFPDVFRPENKVLLLGAGGAARGIYRALVQENFASIDIANRTIDRAKSFLELKENHIETTILSFEEAESMLEHYDFLVQTTSVGMKPNIDSKIIALNKLKHDAVVSDIVYQPLVTSLLQEAKVRGGRIHQGYAMLLYQAELAFEIWTNETVGLDGLLNKLELRLRGKE
ncbi:shikimate dehydrogenase [Aquibacillus salsiterrae]|uniref:Shikimate dehydrogenase (NADP(+)) n=1 Tax=Aquibacillus salsiterrae TaxID=2950439 RepID=A0A9X3WEI6_9BACI|nr:shikimate dehydrogenase [Aquibacillus salsiterrae]MDC3415591.1 shikimate dehydrogenase [Aquibacillus salsiterrae]